MTDKTTTKPEPFKDKGDSLDAHFEWLRARCERLDAERDAAESVSSPRRSWRRHRNHGDDDETSCRIERLRRREDALLTSLNECKAISPEMGLTKVRRDADLTPDMTTVLLALTVVSLGLGEQVLVGLGAASWGSLDVGDTIRILDPSGVSENLRCRSLFEPGSPLVAQGLITVETRDDGAPEELFSSRVSLTAETFKTIVGR